MMTALTHGLVKCVVRSSLPSRAGLLRTNRANYVNGVLPSKYPLRASPVTVLSRQFSLETLYNYPTVLFRTVAESESSVYARGFLTQLHDITGIPWWLTIAASAAVLKVLTSPFRVYQISLLGKLRVVHKEMGEVAKRVKLQTMAKEKIYMWTPEKAERTYRREIRKERKLLIEKYNCHPAKVVLLGYFELPVWMVMSITLRTMAYGFSEDITTSNIVTSQMLVEGPLWCSNLCIPDPTYITSIILALSHLLLIEFGVVHRMLLKQQETRFYKVLTNAGRGFGVLAAIVCSYMPASVALFWCSSTLLTIVRDLVFVSPKVRRALNLPYEPVSYEGVYGAFREKFMWMSKLKGKKGLGPGSK